MNLESFLQSLSDYHEGWVANPRWNNHALARGEEEVFLRFLSFVKSTPQGFTRESLHHVTASALVTTPTLDRVLLTHHRKLGRWLQLGGHLENDISVAAAALREAQEESGLRDLAFLSTGEVPQILDLDIHEIPARKEDPCHLHFDVRYALQTASPENTLVSEESHALAWHSLEKAEELVTERSLLRLFAKLRFLNPSGRPSRAIQRTHCKPSNR